MSQYPHLLSPITSGNVTLNNRAVMGSMHTGLEDRLWHRKKWGAYFARRVEGGVGLIITGGINPNRRAWFYPFSSTMTNVIDVLSHRIVTRAVHEKGGKICMQLLHAGRYSYHPLSQSASSIKSPINPFKPRAMSTRQVKRTIKDFVNAAKLAQKAGYDGVEIMGSEGYLINQFTSPRTNKRTDEYGGSNENRMRFPLEIIEQVRKACGDDFIIIYRLSMLELVGEGSPQDDILELAKASERAGVDLINTGIGWHESRIPTIVTSVPRAAFADVTKKVKDVVTVPVIASNRINTPEVAEDILSQGKADLVSMARPMLADPDFVLKAKEGRRDELNVCIACNQACLDHTFQMKRTTCLVNPQACYETELVYVKTAKAKKIAVIGAGPAGLSCATVAAERGHDVTLFDASDRIGGQFNMAARVPGKEEFWETIKYYDSMLKKYSVTLRLNERVSADDLIGAGFDVVVVATGVTPRTPGILGVDHPKVLSYIDVLRGHAEVGQSVAVIGAGGIGFDVSEFLVQRYETRFEPMQIGEITTPEPLDEWKTEWGVDFDTLEAGGMVASDVKAPARKVYLMQRKDSRVGKNLGKTSGWVHVAMMRKKDVQMVNCCQYDKIDDDGLHITRDGKSQILDVDNVIICAGQVSERSLFDALTDSAKDSALDVHLIGGAELAAELDAKRAIRQGAELASTL
ncbi:MAG: NADPH-dependent 2,4-dienoyl-CoA reductase [Pseudomonadota bacterium]